MINDGYIKNTGDNKMKGKQGSRRTDGLESIEQVAMVVQEVARKSQTVADLFLLGVETQLRGCDVRELAWSELDIKASTLLLKQKKTGTVIRIELTDTAKTLLNARYKERGENVYVFQHDSNRSTGKPVSRAKAAAEIKEAVDHLKSLGQIPHDAVIAMHSSRKTVATMAYKAGEDLAQVSHMLGHKSIDHTRAYIGVTQKASDTLRHKYSTGIKVR